MQKVALLAIIFCSAADALQTASPMRAVRPATAVRAAPSMQFGKKKTAAEKLEEMGYWPGEWLCADCGFIYEVGNDPPFEELKAFWKCPQCAGPRRRFVKKAGDMCASLSHSKDGARCRLGRLTHPRTGLPSCRPVARSLFCVSCSLSFMLALFLARFPHAHRPVRRLGTLDDSGLYQATAAFAVLLIGLVYVGLTI